MKKTQILILFSLIALATFGQDYTIDREAIQEDLTTILAELKQYYVYYDDKSVDYECLTTYYESRIDSLKTKSDVILFFEYLLDEFYDSHLHLNTNVKSSYRLYAPVYVCMKENKPILCNVWSSQIADIAPEALGAEIVRINNKTLDKAIDDFPTQCHDKGDPQIREWIINKLIAGRYDQSRWVTVRLPNGKLAEFNPDIIKLKESDSLLNSSIENEIGIIRINNSLGEEALVHTFDQALDSLMDTKGLILDLRNTVDGGDTYQARGIMGRFIAERKPYQRHVLMERSEEFPLKYPAVERNWLEFVSPRGMQYTKPVVILVGRWTGSMGEGLAIGMEGIGAATIVGSEMERLGGEVYGFDLEHQSFGYGLPGAKLFHVDGTLRENYIPQNYVKQTTTFKDEGMDMSLDLIKTLILNDNN